MNWQWLAILWLVLAGNPSRLPAQMLHIDSLKQHWQQSLKVPDDQVQSVVEQQVEFIGYLPLESKLQARMLALRLAALGTVEERRKFNLLALYLETATHRFINIDSLKQGLVQFVTEASLAEAYPLAAAACFPLSVLAEQLQDYATSAYFGLKGRDLLLRNGNPSKRQLYNITTRLASISFNTAQFRDCVTYGIEALANEDKRLPTTDLRNTIGLGYRGLGIFDSAIYWFQQALTLAEQYGNIPAIGMVQGNMAQVFFSQGQLEQAYPLLQSDVQKSMAVRDVASAMNSLQFMARILALQGKKTEALDSLHTCFANLPSVKNIRYRQNIMEAAALVYFLTGKYDSARYATARQISLRDSMQARISSSRMDAVTVQLNYENSLQQLQKISLEKQLAVQRRNLLAVIILLAGLAAWMWTNRQRLTLKHRQQLLLQEKQAAQLEAAAASAQLGLMTENLMAKSNMLEALQQAWMNNQHSADTQKHLEALRESVILTEDDWKHYRDLFEKVHPGFVQRLRKIAPDISQAELRLAVLTRLQLEHKQMAGMLGISADSVSKTRRRLRDRLSLDASANLEGFLQGV